MPSSNPNQPTPDVLTPAPDHPISAFLQGAGFPFRAAGFLLHRPKLWLLVGIPLILNVILFTLLLWWGFTQFADFLRGFLEGREAWYWDVVRLLAKTFFWGVVLVVVYFVFTPVALLIAAPFNDKLAEFAERRQGFFMPEDGRNIVLMVVYEALFAIFSELKRLILVMSVFVLLLGLHLLPIVGNALYVFLGVAWASWSAAFEFSSYAADRRHWGLRVKWRMLQRNPAAALGYGVVTFGLMLVPFLNVLIVPVSAVGGTYLFCALCPEERARASARTVE